MVVISRRTNSTLTFTLLLLLCITGCGGDQSHSGGGAGIDQRSNEHFEPGVRAGYALSMSEANSRANSMLGQLSFQQKIDLVHGHGSPVGLNGYMGVNYPKVEGAMDKAVGYIPSVPEIGLPANNMVDAQSGITAEGLQATSMPATVGLAATWSMELAHRFGTRIGAEARLLGFTTALGGGVNLIRDPRGGRGFEYMGEDPILAGELAAQRTIGVQDNKVLSTIKHYAFNNIETNRMVANAVVDEQAMRETELLAFEIAITKGSPAYVMCAFNQVNGVYSCENEYLLSEVLKGDWGYDGIVMSDWGAQSSTVDAALNGLDEEQPGQAAQDTQVPEFLSLYMGGPWFIDDLAAAVQSKQVPMERLDDMVLRKLRMMLAIGVVDDPPRRRTIINEAAGNRDAKRIADASIVLMKNGIPRNASGGEPVLPLPKDEVEHIVVVGGYADKGVLSGGGSGGASPLIENKVQQCGQLPISPYPTCPTFIGIAPLEAIREEFPDAEVSYFPGENAEQAASAARNADATIIFAGAWFNAGLDNESMRLPSPETDDSGIFTYDQDRLISTVAGSAQRSIVVLETGQPVLMPWVEEVDAVINAWYPGVQGGYSVAEIISGDVNPSGKLPVTFPKSEDDLVMTELPTNLGGFLGIEFMIKSLANTVRGIVDSIMGGGAYDQTRKILYSENLAWNGYKWMDSRGIEPLFAFGHGLSYSEFSYRNIQVRAEEDGLVVSFDIENVSDRAGTEVAQVYASLPDDVPGHEQPPKKLVGWSRVEIRPGEVKSVSVDVPYKYVSVWDVSAGRWILTPGEYTVIVSDSSQVSRSPNTLSISANINN